MAKPTRKPKVSGRTSRDAPEPVVGLRIIGGRFRGRKLQYSGDLRTRPMKDRLREAVFNLIGPAVKGKHAIDLFAGTGAIGLESLSRGAARATFIEQHYPTAATLRENLRTLDVSDQCEIVTGDVFLWWRRRPDLGPAPWLVFSSPPFDFYVQRASEMLGLLDGLIAAAPDESIFIVEADERFDFGLLPQPDQWDVRQYPPAVIGLMTKNR
jgi:16S rRNA (guanine966-N2)-methyltransferase